MNTINISEIKEGTAFSDDAFIFNNMFFIPKNLPVQKYHLRLLTNWKIDEIFSEGQLTTEGMNRLIEKDSANKTELEKALSENGNSADKNNSNRNTSGNRMNKADDDSPISIESSNSSALLDSSVKSFFELYKKWIKVTYTHFNDIIYKNTVDKLKVKSLISEIINNVNNNRNNALMIFGRKFEGIFYVIPQTIESVILAYIIGDSMNLTVHEMSNLLIATLFHDIGMMRIPKPLLEKTTALTPQEKKLIQGHTTIGYKLLRNVNYSAIIASGALQHHERMDGKGYPNHLPPEKVTDIAKIISVVDAYCAAISSKPYKTSIAHGKEVIQDLLSSGGIAYDPHILKELIKNISFYPIGSLVLLSSNQPARVVGTSGIAMKPIVKILSQGSDNSIINLSKVNDIYIKSLYNENSNNS